MLRRYTFKLYPNKAQEERLFEVSRMCAQLWNALLQMREDVYRRERRTLTKLDQYKAITELRNAEGCEEWATIPATMERGVAASLDAAFQAFFRRAKAGAGASSGYPMYKRTTSATGFTFSDSGGWTFSAVGNRFALSVKGIGTVKARGSIPGTPLAFKTPTVMRRDGSWMVSVVVSMDARHESGCDKIRVKFDLIDEFARVERENGAVCALLERANHKRLQGLSESSGAEPPQNEGERNLSCPVTCASPGAEPPQNEGERNLQVGLTPILEGAEPPQNELLRARRLTERADEIKRDRDLRRTKRSYRWRQETRRVAKISSKAARVRRQALHKWSTQITSLASELTVVAPRVREVTKSARGSENNPGAAVEINKHLNRNTLSQAPALAIQMLSYKAEEAAIPFVLTRDEAHVTTIGGDISAATKTARKTRRALKKVST